MRELNPNHHVTRAAHDHWHKICALILRKLKLAKVEITKADIDEFVRETESGVASNIVLDDRGGKLTVYLVDEAEGQRLARKEGGLPM